MIKPYQFQIGDVVTYWRGTFEHKPLGYMMVVSEEEKGFNLLNFTLSEKETEFETLYCAKDSNVEFILKERS